MREGVNMGRHREMTVMRHGLKKGNKIEITVIIATTKTGGPYSFKQLPASYLLTTKETMSVGETRSP